MKLWLCLDLPDFSYIFSASNLNFRFAYSYMLIQSSPPARSVLKRIRRRYCTISAAEFISFSTMNK